MTDREYIDNLTDILEKQIDHLRARVGHLESSAITITTVSPVTTLELSPEVKAVIRTAREMLEQHRHDDEYAYVYWGDLEAALDAVKDIPCDEVQHA